MVQSKHSRKRLGTTEGRHNYELPSRYLKSLRNPALSLAQVARLDAHVTSGLCETNMPVAIAQVAQTSRLVSHGCGARPHKQRTRIYALMGRSHGVCVSKTDELSHTDATKFRLKKWARDTRPMKEVRCLKPRPNKLLASPERHHQEPVSGLRGA